MEIKLSHNVPKITGYYFVLTEAKSKPHLVLVIIEEGLKPQILNEQNKPLFFKDFPNQFLWSEIINF